MTDTEANAITPSSAPALSIVLRPHGKGASPEALSVSLSIDAGESGLDGVRLKLPIRVASVPCADVPADSVRAHDAAGALGLLSFDDPPDEAGFFHARHFAFERLPQGTVHIHYAVTPNDDPIRRKSGPPFDLIAQEGGVSGAGVSFLMLPHSESDNTADEQWRVRLHWDLRDMPAGTHAVSSFGDGDCDTLTTMSAVHSAFYMAGPLHIVRGESGTHGALNAYWLGEPRFDAPSVLSWLARLYPHMVGMLPNGPTTPFRVLGRGGSIPGSGGAAAFDSFMIGFGLQPEPEQRVKFLLAHELAHPLAGNLGNESLSNSWYAEGLAEFYKLMAPLRAGLVSDEAFLDELTKSTRTYYASDCINLPCDAVPALFWKDPQVQRLPYGRGLMYFLGLNARLRDATGGQRSLDDLVNTMQAGVRDGIPATLARWRALVESTLGHEEALTLDRMIAGQTQIPPSDAIGPRFVCREVTLNVVRLGFDAQSFREGRIISLQPEGAAAAAGLREGDRVLSHDFELSRLTVPGARLTLSVASGDATPRTLQYAPAGHTVTGYQWQSSIDANASREVR